MADATAAGVDRFHRVRERRVAGDAPLHAHPVWLERFPWLVQGTTARGERADAAFDLGLFGRTPTGRVLARWRALRRAAGCVTAVHARQVHGASVQWHEALPHGLVIDDGHDGHATAQPGVLLTVSVADCVPVSVVDPASRSVALLHAGWRGTASGVLEAGMRVLRRRAGAAPDRLWVHLGPAICGRCYEVGPEVHRALGLAEPTAPTPLDLRAVLATRARSLGVADDRISASAHCTRCGGSDGDSGGGASFFSHRGGDAGRQMAVLGIRPSSTAVEVPNAGENGADDETGRPVELGDT
ncbi:MAG: polyphenol oxidase family protein [Gemmatimonadota bacterium]